MTYSHRNGETEPPTIPGRFWFRGLIGRHEAEDLVEVSVDGSVDWWMATDLLSETKGQWWGPVVAPWSEQ